MSGLLSLALVLAGVVPAIAVPQQQPQLTAPATDPIVLDPAATSGTWEGWGISLAWWAKIFGDRKDVADLLFTLKDEVEIKGQKLPGLGLTIARYNAGACSWNQVDGRKMVVSKTILPFRQIEGFWLDGKSADPNSKSWNWNVDANQRTMLRLAQQRGVKQFELFSNSPMWWMCSNANPSGGKSKTADNLPPNNYQAFATYLATIARHAKDQWGITFSSIEPFNEPISGWWVENGKQEGCYFSCATQVAFLPILRKALDERGLREIPIAASDETSYDDALKSWTGFPPAAKALVSRVNVHGYEGEKGPRKQLHSSVVSEGKPLWNSEYGDNLGDGLTLARCLGLDFQQLRPAAWCYWQAIDGRGWGLLSGDLSTKQIGMANPKLFVLAQFSRHIRPGMKILQTGSGDLVAAYDPEGRRLVIVAIGGKNPGEKQIDLSKFRVPNAFASRWITEPKASSRYKKVAGVQITEGRLTLSVPPDSIQTLEISNLFL